MKEKRSQVPFPVFALCWTDGGALILCRERFPLVITEAGKALERLSAATVPTLPPCLPPYISRVFLLTHIPESRPLPSLEEGNGAYASLQRERRYAMQTQQMAASAIAAPAWMMRASGR